MDIRIHKHVAIKLDCTLADARVIRNALCLSNSEAASALAQKLAAALQENGLD